MRKRHARRTNRLSAVAALAILAWVGATLLLAGPGLCQDETAPPSAKADDPEATPGAGEDAAPADEKEAEEEEPVHVESADLMQYDPEKSLYFLTGNVHFRHRDANLYCDEAQYNEEDDTARAVGHLKLVTPDTTVTGDLITADFDAEVTEITGNVRLVTQRKRKAEDDGAEEEAAAEPKPEAGEGDEGGRPKKLDEYREKLTTVTCERLRYWYEEKRAVATGSIVAVQEDKTCYADEATYLEEEDTLTLTGDPVRAVMENGNRFQAPKVTVEIEGDRVWTEGRVTGVFKREKKEEAEGETPPAAPAEAEPEGAAETPPGPPSAPE